MKIYNDEISFGASQARLETRDSKGVFNGLVNLLRPRRQAEPLFLTPRFPAVDSREAPARHGQAAIGSHDDDALNQAWTQGYQEGYNELGSLGCDAPARPRLSIPSQADGKDYVFLMGWEAGMGAAATALGM